MRDLLCRDADQFAPAARGQRSLTLDECRAWFAAVREAGRAYMGRERWDARVERLAFEFADGEELSANDWLCAACETWDECRLHEGEYGSES